MSHKKFEQAALMEEMRNAYKISVGKPEGRRPLRGHS
jgi:hypothetical protein